MDTTEDYRERGRNDPAGPEPQLDSGERVEHGSGCKKDYRARHDQVVG